MQQSEIVVQARPPRSKRVVPLEPSLRYRRINMLVSISLLVLVVSIAVFFWGSPFYSGFWEHSYLSFSFTYIFYGFVCVFSAPPWKSLDKRRQQASRYNLTVGLPGQATQAYLADLPPRFMVRLRPHWLATCIAGIVCGFILMAASATLYSYWQASIQAVLHQGMPLILAVLQNCFDIATLLVIVVGIIIPLFYRSRQQIIATPDGLFCQHIYHSSYIPWQEAHLFAVISRQYSKKRGKILYYELASADTVIRWPSQARGGSWIDMPSAVSLIGGNLAGPTTSAETFQQEVQLLNIIVNARSGLPLYDLC